MDWPFRVALAVGLVSLIAVLGWTYSSRDLANGERLADELMMFEPQTVLHAPARYVNQSRQLLKLFVGALSPEQARFRALLEEGLSYALGRPRDAASKGLATALEGSRDQLLRAIAFDVRRQHTLWLWASGAQVACLLCLLYGVGQLTARGRRRQTQQRWPAGNIDALLFDHTPVPIAFSDAEDVVQSVNAAFLRMTGFDLAETVGHELLQTGDGTGLPLAREEMRVALRQEGRWQGDLWLRHKNGEAIASKVRRFAVSDRCQQLAGYLTISSESLLADEQQRLMLWQAHHDPLTKLPNRITLEEQFRRTMQQPEAEGLFLTIDIDRFKDVNDSVGAQVADHVLADAAFRLAMCSAEGDLVARVGGDTFALISHGPVPMDRAHALCDAMLSAFKEPFDVAGHPLTLNLSIGASLFPRDGVELAEVMQKADAARNDVKARGGNAVGYFQAELNERAQRRFELQIGLRDAVANGELHLELQPIVRIARSDYLGAEALLRWTHPTMGRVSPAEFIPIAEETGLIEAIGLWVMREAKDILEVLAAAGRAHLRLSVNVSAVQLRTLESCERLLDEVRRSEPQRLTLEITESALIDHSSNAKHFLDVARQLGCQVALDDFGTGFSAMAYLRDYTFDVLKIDKSFIDSLSSPRDLGLVASIVSMGKILGMRVVAEGIEEREQVEQLNRIGCHFAQGYYFSRPVSVADFLRLVGEGSVPNTA